MKPYALGLDETKTRCRITETRNKREKREVKEKREKALF
jgi:hypothetical protein